MSHTSMNTKAFTITWLAAALFFAPALARADLVPKMLQFDHLQVSASCLPLYIGAVDGRVWFTQPGCGAPATILGESNIVPTVKPTAKSYAIAAAETQGVYDGLWTSDAGGRMVYRFSLGAEVPVSFAALLPDMPFGISVDTIGRPWVALPRPRMIGRLNAAGDFDFACLPTTHPALMLAADRQGTIYFTELGSKRLGRISSSDMVSEVDITNEGLATWVSAGRLTWGGPRACSTANPRGPSVSEILANPPTRLALDSRVLWFTNGNCDAARCWAIGSLDQSNHVTHFFAPSQRSSPADISIGIDGVWFTEPNADKVALFSNGSIREYQLPVGSHPFGVFAERGTLWLTEPLSGRIVYSNSTYPKVHTSYLNSVTPKI